MINRPIQVQMKALTPAPSAPMRGKPQWPKMSSQQKSTLKTFITMAATRCTCVRPMPSKKPFTAMVMAMEMTPSRRHQVYE